MTERVPAMHLENTTTHLKVDGEQRSVPVVGDKQEVIVPVRDPAALHVPRRLECRLAQQSLEKRNAHRRVSSFCKSSGDFAALLP